MKIFLISLALSISLIAWVDLQVNQREIQIYNLYIVVDFDLYQEMRDKSLSVEKRVESIFIYVNKIYGPLKIQFRVVQIDIWTIEWLSQTPEYYIPYELKSYKSQFVNTLHDCLHLFMRPNSNLKRSGYGEKFSMCSRSSCIGYTIDSIFHRINDTAFIMAHEIGHNFGLDHDTSSCGCLSCIMATGMEISSRSQNWSRCSIKEIESIILHGSHSCLRSSVKNRTIKTMYISDRWLQQRSNYKTVLINTSFCGNGLVEDNEECDCLGNPDCVHCCNIAICRFVVGASCATGQCCNTTTCRVKSKGTLCRSSSNSCDLPENCDGMRELCGDDLYIADGSPCTTIYNESAFCFDGKCQNQMTQCRLLWGDSANVSSVDCYHENRNKNHKFKNCGDSMTGKSLILKSDVSYNDRPIACGSGDVICGRLWCDHFNERLMTLGVSETFSFLQGDHFCQAVIFEYDWRMRDLGMVPDGSLCGTNKMCYGRKCIPIWAQKCQCNGHGVCNNRNQCHCEAGYALPYCNKIEIITTTKLSISISKSSGTYKQTVDSISSHNSRRYTAIGIAIFLLVILVGVLLIRIIEILRDNRELYGTLVRRMDSNQEIISRITFNAPFLKAKLIKERNHSEASATVNGISEPESENREIRRIII